MNTERVLAWLRRSWPALALLALYYLMAITGVLHKSLTFDEIAHIAAGYGYNALGDFRLQPENGNLPQRWVAIPAVFSGAKFPTLDQLAWHYSDVWVMGDQFFFDVGNDADSLLWRARAMVAILGVACGALVFGWSRRLFPGAGAWVSLTLFVFSPTMLAHGALATSDMSAALFFTATVGALWLVLHRLTLTTLALSTLVMGGLFVAKFSAPLIVPIGIIMVAVRLISSQPLVLGWREPTRAIVGRWRRLLVYLGLMGVHVVVAWLVIWAAYDFRFSAFEAGTNGQDRFVVDLAAMRATPMPMQGFVNFATEHKLLPEAYVYGFAHTLRFAEKRSAFLNGEYSVDGWASFFPYAFLVKTTLPLLAMLLVALAAFFVRVFSPGPSSSLRRFFAGIYSITPLWTLLAVYWGFAVTSHLNIGHRHLLPTYPALMILAGSAGYGIDRALAAWRAKRAGSSAAVSPVALVAAGAVVLLLVGQVSASLVIRPHYLAFFNSFVGSENGYKHLIDSSLDWGQDLPGLKSWLDEQGLSGSGPHDTVYLSYFGTGRPSHEGIDATLLPGFFDHRPPHVPQALHGGYYCISASMLQSVYLSAPGRWTADYEQFYQQLRQAMVAFDRTAGNQAARDALIQNNGGPDRWWQLFALWEQWRLARLNAYLRQREPLAEIGYSILIYKLSDAEVQDALFGPAPLGK